MASSSFFRSMAVREGKRPTRPVDQLKCPFAIRVAECPDFVSTQSLSNLASVLDTFYNSRGPDEWKMLKKSCFAIGINQSVRCLKKQKDQLRLMLIDRGLQCELLLQVFFSTFPVENRC